MICQRDPPQTTPTAVTSAGNSRSAFSTRRPKNGTPAAIIGTTAAGMPIVVPVSQYVNGIMAAISTRNGSERPILTTQFSSRYSSACGNKPRGEALNNTTPTSPPSVTTNSITMATISQVSP